MKDKNGTKIEAGDTITTWGSKTEYLIVEDNGILVLDGVKPLSEVGCTPIIIKNNLKR